MIKNIVFDLGNVLISFDPSAFLDKKNYPENIKTRILSDIYYSKEWRMLDNGDISTREAIDKIAMTSTLRKEEIALIFKLRTEVMYPLDQNVKLLPELKKHGFKLFFLSNFALDTFEEVKTGYYFFRYFDGGVVSSEVKHSKPESKIYEILLEQYSLVPSECIFIDDIEINVKVAESFGMKGITTFASPDISEKLRTALKDFEI